MRATIDNPLSEIYIVLHESSSEVTKQLEPQSQPQFQSSLSILFPECCAAERNEAESWSLQQASHWWMQRTSPDDIWKHVLSSCLWVAVDGSAVFDESVVVDRNVENFPSLKKLDLLQTDVTKQAKITSFESLSSWSGKKSRWTGLISKRSFGQQ